MRNVAQALLPVSWAEASHAKHTSKSARASEAKTGHGWDAVTERLPAFVGRPEASGRHPRGHHPVGEEWTHVAVSLILTITG